VAITGEGAELPFDRLLVAVGAIQRPGLPGAVVFRGPADRRPIKDLLSDAEDGAVRRIVFCAPVGVGWPLPLYELALMTAAHLHERQVPGVHLALVTPEPSPLAVFGPRGSAAVRKLLAARGIELRTSVYPASVEASSLTLAPGGWIEADRVVTLPALRGPAIPGLPHDADGFIPVDEHCAVEGLDDVYAAGDATTFPVKQGGIAAQMADAAAASIAASLGSGPREPFRPVLRGMLLTGYTPTFLRAEPAGRSHGTNTGVAAHSLWEPAAKIAARHLAPYLAGLGHAQLDRPELRDLDEEPTGAPVQTSAEHSAAVELALALADADAGWSDYREALEWLDRVESIEGVLPEEYEERRARWSRALSHQEGS
jgi:sulfide:quinone oxidoreductase